MREFRNVVLNLAEVTRVDSTGMGLLVRFLSHMRNRSGDLRLAEPAPFLMELLRMTKLASIFRVYDSEEQAILSFLKDPIVRAAHTRPAGPVVLFVDSSPDLCAFVRALLANHGYEALSTCRLHDAKLLMTATKFDCVVLGPDGSQFGSQRGSDALASVAQGAPVVQLPADFKY
jgi:hypothetical protein